MDLLSNVLELFSVDPLAELILRFMKERETVLFNNAAFLASVFLNPSWKHTIPSSMVPDVIEHLCELKKRIDDVASKFNEEAGITTHTSSLTEINTLNINGSH